MIYVAFVIVSWVAGWLIGMGSNVFIGGGVGLALFAIITALERVIDAINGKKASDTPRVPYTEPRAYQGSGNPP